MKSNNLHNNEKPYALNLLIAGFGLSIKFIPGINPLTPVKGIINSLQSDTEKYFRNFIVNRPLLKISHQILLYPFYPYLLHKDNRKFIFSFEEKKDMIITHQSIGIHELIIIVRYVLNKLLSENQGILIHASGNLVCGKANVFLASSGGGKSTIVKLTGGKYRIICDDLAIIRMERGVLKFYQAPFFENGMRSKNISDAIPVGGMFFLDKASDIRVTKIINKKQIVRLLTHQMGTEEIFLNKQIGNILRIADKYDIFYRLHFPKERKTLLEFFRGFAGQGQ